MANYEYLHHANVCSLALAKPFVGIRGKRNLVVTVTHNNRFCVTTEQQILSVSGIRQMARSYFPAYASSKAFRPATSWGWFSG